MIRLISYFPEMYYDELLYNAIGRYSRFTCQSKRGTLLTTYDDKNTLPSVEFPCHLGYLAKALSLSLSKGPDYLISNHTLYPYYSIFLPTKRQNSIRDKMINGDGKGIKTEIGFIAGSICRKLNLFYCPECLREELSILGEGYFHRLHQAQGVYVCPKHKTLLLEYPIKFTDESRLSFITLEGENLDSSHKRQGNEKLYNTMLMIASGAEFLLNNDLNYINKDIIHESCIEELKKKDFVTVGGRIRQHDLCKSIIDFYGAEILNFYDSNIDIYDEYNWVKVLARNAERTVHPLRHLMFINFLTGDLEGFINNIKGIKKKTDILYPCLNPASDHYRGLVVKDVKITADSKTKEPIGTFKCECGFIYSRRMHGDKYKIGRIKFFGETWESKLKNLILQENITVSGIARELRCDYKTVVKYASKLGLKEQLKTNMIIEFSSSNNFGNPNSDLFSQYKMVLTQFLQENPNTTYCEVRDKIPREFNLIYRYDRDWIRDNIPRKQIRRNSMVDYEFWQIRDVKLSTLLYEIYESLSDVEIKKFSKTMLIRKSGKQATIEKNLDKLPLCKEFLNKVIYLN